MLYKIKQPRARVVRRKEFTIAQPCLSSPAWATGPPTSSSVHDREANLWARRSTLLLAARHPMESHLPASKPYRYQL